MGMVLMVVGAFMLGVLITGLFALGVIAILFREAEAMVDSYMHAIPGVRVPRGRPDWQPRIVASGGGRG